MLSVQKYFQDRTPIFSRGSNQVVVDRPHEHNPLRLLSKLSGTQWACWLLGFLAWSWDAFDYHSVTLSLPDLVTTFGRTEQQMTAAVTLTLMARPLGGIIFGGLADRYGRKWPFIADCFLLIIFVLATGFCQTYGAFLVVRTLFGVAMGGIYGNAAATALEDVDEDARGLMSGLYQSGYPFGYILASSFYRAFKDHTKYSWRPLFWFGACPPVLLMLFRLCMHETTAFQSRERVDNQQQNVRVAASEVVLAVRNHWVLLSYLSLLLTGFVYCVCSPHNPKFEIAYSNETKSHNTQDLFPTVLKYTYGYSVSQATVVQIIGASGGMVGSAVTGYCSQFFGRRLSIILTCILGGALIYPYGFTPGPRIYATAFFEQFCAQGFWGIVPIHLMELSPPAHRTFIVGTAYQLGVLIASPCNTIITHIGLRYPLPIDSSGIQHYDYRVPICALTGCMFAYVMVLAAVGPEKRGRDMMYHAGEETGSDNENELPVSKTTRVSSTRFV